MIPIRDENPPRGTPYVTYLIIALNVAVYLWQITVPDAEQMRYLMIPAEIVTGREVGPVYTVQPYFMTIFTAMFMHAGFMHIAGNMLYLWIFGDNVEDMLGHGMYLIFYLASGLAAALAQIMLGPFSTVPTLGASGAVAGVLGAYLITHPGARVMCIIYFGIFFSRAWLPAWIVLGGWIVLQILSLPQTFTQNGGVAYAAHVGGFFAGIVLFRLLGGKKDREAPIQREGWRYRGNY